MKWSEMTEQDKNLAVQGIEYNVSEEAIAREEYYKLLNQVADEHKQEIKGIIEDEINHSIILMKLAEIYSGNKPTEFENIDKLRRINNE